jgi:hypothetical protein
MIVIGILLLISGFILKIAMLGVTGRAVGGRRHCW